MTTSAIHVGQARVEGRRIKASFARYNPAMAEKLRSLVEYEYNPATRVWSLAATPFVAWRLAGWGIDLDESAGQLAERWAKGQSGEPAKPSVWAGPAHWKHQLAMFGWSKDKPGSMLAADMGTGKSRAAVDVAAHNGCKRVLIVAPKSVVPQWAKQFAQYSGVEYDYLPLVGNASVAKRCEQLDWALKSQGTRRPLAVGVNYDVIGRPEMLKLLASQKWDLLVCDESHRLKGATTGVCKAARKIAPQCGQVLELTGTPMPHSWLDLFGQFELLDPGIFGSRWLRFRDRYAVTHKEYKSKVLAWKNLDELTELFSLLAFRVRSEDVLDLPETVDIEVDVQLPDSVMKQYKALKRDLCAELDHGTLTIDNVLVKSLRLLQLASGALPNDDGLVADVHREKEAALEDLLDGIDRAEPVVVFAQFRPNLDAVRRVAQRLGRRALELSGRQNDLAEFVERGQPGDVIAIQTQAGGTGVDGLFRAAYCIYYSIGHNTGDYLQSRKRVHRPGQTRRTTYYHLVARGTIDVAVRKAHEQRLGMAEAILAHLKGVE